MALYATNRFAGDGVTTSYEFNFAGKYIARPHVKVYQEDDATGARTPVAITDSNFLNDTTLRNLPVTPVGKTLVIYRDTPKPPLVDFTNGARFTETNLDTATRQGSFIAVESADALSPDGLAGFINYLAGFSSSAETARDQAAWSAGQASLAAGQAASSASSASTKAAEALASAVSAELAKDNAVAAAGAIGPIKFFDTKAQADAAIGTMANGAILEVSQDETRAGARTRYRVQAGALVFVVNLDQVGGALAAPSGASLVGYQQAGTGAVVRTAQDKMRELVSVRDFGAVGDGVTDDTAAFQAAAAYFGSGGVLATANGGVLLVPKGLYKITGQTLFQQPGVRVIGEGQEATKIIVAANLGAAAVFKFDQTRTDYSMVGVGVENLRIDMAGFTGHGVQMLKPYDGVSLRNLFVDNVADGYNGYRIEPDPGVQADAISQTLLLENCIAIHKNATATAPLFYISNMQEAVLTGCKAFGTYDSNGKAACYPFEFVDCRGIMLNGCSSAFASKHGVKITVATRPSIGILIANHTFETIDGAVRADGLAGIGDVIGLSVINPRTEGAVANASGTFDLNRVIRSSIDAGVSAVNIDADSISNSVLSGDTTQVTNAGITTTILGSANQADTRYKIIAGGLRVSSAGTKHIDTSNAAVQLYSGGAISAQADYPFGASQVGVLLAVNRAGTVTLSRVEVGAPDSGGAGFRMLRVAN